MKIKSLSFASVLALVALLSAFIAVPAAVSAQGEDDTDSQTGTDMTNVTDIQVTGTTNDGGTFAGTFSIDEFVSDRDGELLAVGTLTGEVTDAAGGAVEQITEESVTLPVTSESSGDEGLFCGDFSVSLGPADIDLSTPDDDMPDDGTPDDDATDDGTQDDGTPDDDATDDGTPEDGTPEDDATDDGTPEDDATDDGTPEDGAPEEGTPEDGMSDDGTRDDDASDDTTPEEITPEEVNPDEINPDDDAADDGQNDDGMDEVEADLHLDAVTINVAAGSGDVGAVVGDVLCNLNGLFGNELDSASIAGLLNLILQLV